MRTWEQLWGGAARPAQIFVSFACLLWAAGWGWGDSLVLRARFGVIHATGVLILFHPSSCACLSWQSLEGPRTPKPPAPTPPPAGPSSVGGAGRLVGSGAQQEGSAVGGCGAAAQRACSSLRSGVGTRLSVGCQAARMCVGGSGGRSVNPDLSNPVTLGCVVTVCRPLLAGRGLAVPSPSWSQVPLFEVWKPRLGESELPRPVRAEQGTRWPLRLGGVGLPVGHPSHSQPPLAVTPLP